MVSSADSRIIAAPFASLSRAQTGLLLRLARAPNACRGRDAVTVKGLVERGLVRMDSRPGEPAYYEIAPAGRRFIAMTATRVSAVSGAR
jgi:hypothetical protein